MRIPPRAAPAALAALCALSCGCADTGRGAAARPAAIISRQASISEDLKEVRLELRALRASQEEIEHRYSDEAFVRPMEERCSRIGARLDAVEKRVEEIEKGAAGERAAAERRIQAVVEVVKAENAQLREDLAGIRGETQGAGYTVRPGDTLEGIARRFGVPAREIIKTNGISDPDARRAGRRLKIPAPAR